MERKLDVHPISTIILPTTGYWYPIITTLMMQLQTTSSNNCIRTKGCRNRLSKSLCQWWYGTLCYAAATPIRLCYKIKTTIIGSFAVYKSYRYCSKYFRTSSFFLADTGILIPVLIVNSLL